MVFICREGMETQIEWTCGHSGGIEDGTNGESSIALPCVK